MGLLLTPQRRALAEKWIWIGGALAFLIVLPNLAWNARHDWPFLQLMHNIRMSGRDILMGPLQFLAVQVLVMTPVTLPLSIAGLWYLVCSPGGSVYRTLGWAFVATLGLLMILHGKLYYSAPAYPVLFSAGAVAIEAWIERTTWGWLKPAVVVVLVVGAVPFVPIVLPVLPIDTYLRYQANLPFPLPHTEKSHLRAALPQHYADEFGWPEMVSTTARVYDSLPPAERAKAAIFADNYGECGAIDFFGRKHGLPHCISGHQNYFLWGPGSAKGEVVIMLGLQPRQAQPICRDVQIAAALDNPYNPLESDPVLLCRGLKQAPQELWSTVKSWD